MTRKRTEAAVSKASAQVTVPHGLTDGGTGVGPLRVPVAKEGIPFILIAVAVTVFVFWLTGSWFARAPLLLITAFVVAFFRDPERIVPADDNAIVSPADGRVIKAERVMETRILKAEALKISIFMNVFNVHVNRFPASGSIRRIIYNPGKFFSADLDKASLENEQNALVVEGPGGKIFAFNQIAGLIARRIVCRVSEGMALKRGERFGLIRFGSRVDVYLPVDCRVIVKIGQKVSAGSSIIGYWR